MFPNPEDDSNFNLILVGGYCFPAFCPARSSAGNNKLVGSHGRPSRATLKRNIPSFTVEVRRQPRRASNPSANGRLFETAPIRTAFDRDTQRAADAVFEAKAPEQPLPNSAPSAPKGRNFFPASSSTRRRCVHFARTTGTAWTSPREGRRNGGRRGLSEGGETPRSRGGFRPRRQPEGSAIRRPRLEAIDEVRGARPAAASREKPPEAPAPRRRTKRRSGGARRPKVPDWDRNRSLAQPSRNPHRGSSRTVRRQRLLPPAKFRRILASERSWAATSMATNSSPASAAEAAAAQDPS